VLNIHELAINKLERCDMKLRTVFVRFYKSFNYDYLRKFHPKAKRYPWEWVEELWYPFVRVPIDPRITTVVGANESGKTHLLSAIEKGITGENIQREDFCRYSQFFTVEKGRMRWPDFGFEWVELSKDEQEVLRQLAGIAESIPFDSVHLFRLGKDEIKAFVREGDEFHGYHVKKPHPQLTAILPRVLHIDPDVALPDSVPIRALASGQLPEVEIERGNRYALFETGNIHPEWFSNTQAISSNASGILAEYSKLLKGTRKQRDKERRQKEFQLASDLLFKVARIDQAAFEELYNSLKDGREGLANGIIQRMNDLIDSAMNFPRWWVQDKNFQLLLSPREFDLVFTIRDKTNTDYSFGERSSGLKYFLSYYTQYRAHTPPTDKGEILLMDEPDAYLSSQAQQDLLKIFDGFASPEKSEKGIQVIYVTHSPFLIDKNHSERIRVLEKGIGDEGTRVVKDTARNHYEPLRSAFGAFVGETTFIGNSNIILEGQSDQILLAGLAVRIGRTRSARLETIDLNAVTLVPAGSALSIPYLVYLARGRDIERPPIVVLMDSDDEGNRAKRQLRRGGAHGKLLLEDRYVLQIGDLKSIQSDTQTVKQLEDLIPLQLAALAVRYYLKTVVASKSEYLSKAKEEGLKQQLEKGLPMWEAITNFVSDVTGGEHHIEKVGFARCLLDSLETNTTPDELVGTAHKSALVTLENNMKILFVALNEKRRAAERELSTDRIASKVERLKRRFIQDFPKESPKEHVHVLFEEIEASLNDDDESEEVRLVLSQLRREYQIDKNLTEPMHNYAKFIEALERVKYAGRYASQEDYLPELMPADVLAPTQKAREVKE
jgi:predicted ATPase